MSDFNIVNTRIDYTYDVLEEDIAKLKDRFSFIETGVMGSSVLGKNLSYIRLGEGANNIFLNGTHNALEWMTSLVLMKFIEDFCLAYENDEKIKDYDIKDIFKTSSIYIVPMVNPDGVDLVLKGIEDVQHEGFGQLVAWNKNNSDFSNSWQSNMNGVDLKHNYNGFWKEYKLYQVKNKISGPNALGYSGQHPESEPESAAIANFTRYGDFSLVLTFSGKGKEIYWDYKDISESSKYLGMKLSEVSGYEIKTPKAINSINSYSSWFINTFDKPGFTVGVDSRDKILSIEDFNHMYDDIVKIILTACVVTGKGQN